MLAYEYMDFHRMAIYGVVALVILLVVARLLIGRS
jgi:hypothetical protein